MRNIYISLMIFGTLMFGIGVANVSTLITSAVAGACECEGCPCSHCSGKSKVCNCKK
jgi:hypothetical protein